MSQFFEQENPRFCRSLPCFSDDSEFLHRVSLLELRVRDASNSGEWCSAVSSCTSLASKILLVHRCFSPLWVPLIQIGVLVATLVLLVVAMRAPTAFAGWPFREILLVLAALKLRIFYLEIVVGDPVIQ